MRRVKLTQGKFAKVDDSDYVKISKNKWQYHKSKNTGYAVRRSASGEIGYIDRTHRQNIFMHQEILGVRKGVDHRNRNGLDNRRKNLRIANQSQNMANAKRRLGVANFRGVTYDALRTNGRCWIGQIHVNKKRRFLGYFRTAKEAAKAYNIAAKECFGEFARLNTF